MESLPLHLTLQVLDSGVVDRLDVLKFIGQEFYLFFLLGDLGLQLSMLCSQHLLLLLALGPLLHQTLFPVLDSSPHLFDPVFLLAHLLLQFGQLYL